MRANDYGINWLAYATILVAGFAVLYLSPVLHSPFLGDDSWRESVLRGVSLLTHRSLPELMEETSRDFIRSGRWYPLVIYYYPVFFYLDLQLYKCVTLALVLGNMMIFVHFVRLITSSRYLAVLALLLAPLMIQFRYYHDPVLSYYFLMQIEFALLMLSAIWFFRYLRNHRFIFLFGSVVAYAISIMVYEAFYLSWLLHVALAWNARMKSDYGRVARQTFPFVAVAALNLTIALLIRSVEGVSYEGTRASFDPISYLVTFAKQTASALPLSHAFAAIAQGQIVCDWATDMSRNAVALGLAWLVLWVFVILTRSEADSKLNGGEGGRLLLCGLALVLPPAAIVALSEKYQNELRWGWGYLPAYIEAFGVVLMALFLASRARFRLIGSPPAVRWIAAAVATVIGFGVCVTNYINNDSVVERYRTAELRPRECVQRAMKSGLLRFVPDGSYVLCGDPLHSWDNPAFFRQWSGLTLQVVKPQGFLYDAQMGSANIEDAFAGFRVRGVSGTYDFHQNETSGQVFSGYGVQFQGLGWPLVRRVCKQGTSSSRHNAYFLKYEAFSENCAYVVLARLKKLKLTPTERVSAISADKIWIYLEIPEDCSPAHVSVAGRVINEWLESRESVCFRAVELKSLGRCGSGELFELACPRQGLDVDPGSIVAALNKNPDGLHALSH